MPSCTSLCGTTFQQRHSSLSQAVGQGAGAWGPAHGDSRALGHHGEDQHTQPHLG